MASSKFPWLLYAYPWMPYPRRVILYLREKGIPDHQVQIVEVSSEPETWNKVKDPVHPPRPSGSLPILAIPTDSVNQFIYIRQSNAIMNYLEELCNNNQQGFSAPYGSLLGNDAISRARSTEVQTLADECTVAWNPVRLLGTGAGTMKVPEASKEMLRWVRRSLTTIERWWAEEDRDMSLLQHGRHGYVTMGDISLYQFLEFTKDCYGVDLTIGSGETVLDVYGREVKEEFPKLREFYTTFSSRESAERREAFGDVPIEVHAKKMQKWYDGIL